MAIPKIPSQKERYKNLNRRLANYVSLVQALYDKYNQRAAKIAIDAGYEGDGEFHFDSVRSKKLIADIQRDFVDDMHTIIYSGVSSEWRESNKIQDLLADNVLAFYDVVKKDGSKYRKYYQTNSDALKAFNDRRARGLNLSKNIWNQAEDYKVALEESISAGIQKGMSAITLSKRVSQYLNDFDKLRDDYTDKFGKASRVKNCEYRSIRLARSEINMAYRTAEQTRWKQMDFILGYEIKLSKAHKHEDICDCLAGKYPKDFQWTGWHPNDMCYAVPIIMSDEEFWGFDEDGNEVESSPRYVTDVPKGFKDYVKEHHSKIVEAEKRGTLPYFLRDNKDYYNSKVATLVPKAKQLRIERLNAISDSFYTFRAKDSITTPKHERLLQEYEKAYEKAQKAPSDANVKAVEDALNRLKVDKSYKFLQLDYTDNSAVEALLSEYFRQYSKELPYGVVEVIDDYSNHAYMATDCAGRFYMYGNANWDVRAAMQAIKGERFFKYQMPEERALQALYHEVRHNTVGNYGFASENPLRYVCESVHELVSLYDYPRFIENIGGKAMFQKELIADPAYGEFISPLRVIFKKYKVNEKKIVAKFKELEDANPIITFSDIASAIVEVNPYVGKDAVYVEIRDMFVRVTADYVKKYNL